MIMRSDQCRPPGGLVFVLLPGTPDCNCFPLFWQTNWQTPLASHSVPVCPDGRPTGECGLDWEPCKVCGKTVSLNAKTCPHCGGEPKSLWSNPNSLPNKLFTVTFSGGGCSWYVFSLGPSSTLVLEASRVMCKSWSMCCTYGHYWSEQWS